MNIKFYNIDNSNYIGFKAPPLIANQIWILPNIINEIRKQKIKKILKEKNEQRICS